MYVEKKTHHKSEGKNVQHNTDRLECSNRYKHQISHLTCMHLSRTKKFSFYDLFLVSCWGGRHAAFCLFDFQRAKSECGYHFHFPPLPPMWMSPRMRYLPPLHTVNVPSCRTNPAQSVGPQPIQIGWDWRKHILAVLLKTDDDRIKCMLHGWNFSTTTF